MSRPPKTLREGLEAITYASDDGSEYEHTHPDCLGESGCDACWAESIRAVLAAHPVDVTPVATKRRLAEVLDPAAFDENKSRSKQPAAQIQWAARVHMAYVGADRLLAAGVFRDEAMVKAEAVEEFVATAGIWPDSAQVTIGTVREQGAKHVAGLRGKAAW